MKKVIINNIEEGSTLSYTITADGFETVTGTINVMDDSTHDIILAPTVGENWLNWDNGKTSEYMPTIIGLNYYNLRAPIKKSSFEGYNMTQFSFADSNTTINQVYEADTRYVTNMRRAFEDCSTLTSIPLMEAGNVLYFDNAFNGCTSLTTVGGFRGLKVSISFSDCPLTHQSAINVIEYAATVQSGTITFSSSTYGTLTTEEITFATNKGWTIATV